MFNLKLKTCFQSVSYERRHSAATVVLLCDFGAVYKCSVLLILA